MPATYPSQQEPEWFVYIVRCRDQSYYTGITTDLKRRLDEHNRGLGAKYTRPRRPVELVYSESALSRSAAARREFAIKKLTPEGKKSLIAAAPAGVQPDIPGAETAETGSGK